MSLAADAASWLRWLVLLGVANVAPLVARRIAGDRWTQPLDGGLRFLDGEPLLGPSKTVRGLVVSVIATMVMATVLGLTPAHGALIGALAMAGDACSSFLKRRLRVPPSGRATGLDQIPEALLPLTVLRVPSGLDWSEVFALTLLFFLLEPPFARLWHRLGWRDTPY